MFEVFQLSFKVFQKGRGRSIGVTSDSRDVADASIACRSSSEGKGSASNGIFHPPINFFDQKFCLLPLEGDLIQSLCELPLYLAVSVPL